MHLCSLSISSIGVVDVGVLSTGIEIIILIMMKLAAKVLLPVVGILVVVAIFGGVASETTSN